MSWNHCTVGFGTYSTFVRVLSLIGIKYTEEQKDEEYVDGADLSHTCWCCEDEECPCCTGTCNHLKKLRIAKFTAQNKQMVVEEYLQVKDCDCDGTSVIDISVYEQGHRPDLITEVLEY